MLFSRKSLLFVLLAMFAATLCQYQAAAQSIPRPVKDLVDFRRDYFLEQPFQYSPDDPWQRGNVYQHHTGHAGFFYNCDGEECKRNSPYICWKVSQASPFPEWRGLQGLVCDIEEIKQRIRDGACCSDCGSAGCAGNCQSHAYSYGQQGFVEQSSFAGGGVGAVGSEFAGGRPATQQSYSVMSPFDPAMPVEAPGYVPQNSNPRLSNPLRQTAPRQQSAPTGNRLPGNGLAPTTPRSTVAPSIDGPGQVSPRGIIEGPGGGLGRLDWLRRETNPVTSGNREQQTATRTVAERTVTQASGLLSARNFIERNNNNWIQPRIGNRQGVTPAGYQNALTQDAVTQDEQNQPRLSRSLFDRLNSASSAASSPAKRW